MTEALAESPDRKDLKKLIDAHDRQSKRYRKTETLVSMTPGSVSANSSVQVEITVPSTTQQTIGISGQVQDAGMIVTADVIADSLVRVNFFNTTGSPIVAKSGEYRVKVFQ